MGWWRSYIRSKTKPIPMERAFKMKRRLSMAYLFCAWNAFFMSIYFLIKEDNPKNPEEEIRPSKYYARLLGSPDAKVLRYEGFKLVDEYEIKAADRPERGKTWIEREREEWAQKEREREERKKKDREDLNLLVEETNSQ